MEITDEIIVRHRSLVKMAAGRHWSRLKGKTWLSLDDLMQAGYIGLIEGLRRYDESKGFAEVTFLWPTVNYSILKEISKNNHSLKVGQRFKSYASKIHASESKDVSELAKMLQISVSEVKVMQQYLVAQVQSFDYTYDPEGEFMLYEVVGGADPTFEENEARAKIAKYCNSQLDHEIVRLREWGYTLSEIAQMVEHVPNLRWNRGKNQKQISEALRRIRRRMRKGEEHERQATL